MKMRKKKKRKLTEKQRDSLLAKMLETEEGKQKLSQIMVDEVWRHLNPATRPIEETLVRLYEEEIEKKKGPELKR